LVAACSRGAQLIKKAPQLMSEFTYSVCRPLPHAGHRNCRALATWQALKEPVITRLSIYLMLGPLRRDQLLSRQIGLPAGAVPGLNATSTPSAATTGAFTFGRFSAMNVATSCSQFVRCAGAVYESHMPYTQ